MLRCKAWLRVDNSNTHLCSFNVAEPHLMALEVLLALGGQIADNGFPTSDSYVGWEGVAGAFKGKNGVGIFSELGAKHCLGRCSDCCLNGRSNCTAVLMQLSCTVAFGMSGDNRNDLNKSGAFNYGYAKTFPLKSYCQTIVIPSDYLPTFVG